MADFISITKNYPERWEDVHLKFKNRPLEKFSFEMWSYTLHLKYIKAFLPEVRDGLKRCISLADELIGLMTVIIEANEGEINGKNFHLTEEASLNAIMEAAEKTLETRLDEFKIQEFYQLYFPLVPKEFAKKCCEEILDRIPNVEDIHRRDGGHFDCADLSCWISELKQAKSIAEDMIPSPEKELIVAVIAHAKCIGVPMNETAFRDLYDFLVMANEVPEEILKGHNASPDPYAPQRYIKSIYRRNAWIKDLEPLPNRTTKSLEGLGKEEEI